MLPLVVRISDDDERSAEQLKLDGWREIEVLETWQHEAPQYFADDHLLTTPNDLDWPFIIRLVGEVEWQDRLHRDRAVLKTYADQAKVDWITAISKCPTRKTYALIRRDENTGPDPMWCGGFIAVWPGSEFDTIDLWAVRPDYQIADAQPYWWLGTSRQLLECAIVRSASKRLRAGTQETNIAARTCYERIGMKIMKRQRTFHK